ncbi:unnamed protein product [Lepidochelys kempii]
MGECLEDYIWPFKRPQKHTYFKAFKMADCSCLMWGIFWLIVLVFFGWPLSIVLGGLYGFLSPLTTLIGLDDFSEALLKGVNLGRQCAKNVQNGKPLC